MKISIPKTVIISVVVMAGLVVALLIWQVSQRKYTTETLEDSYPQGETELTYTSSKHDFKIQYPATFTVKTRTFYDLRGTNENCVIVEEPNPLEKNFFVMVHPRSAGRVCQTDVLMSQETIPPTETKMIQQKVTVDGKAYTVNGISVRNPRDSYFEFFQFTPDQNTITFGGAVFPGTLSASEFDSMKATIINIVESYRPTR